MLLDLFALVLGALAEVGSLAEGEVTPEWLKDAVGAALVRSEGLGLVKG
jgi:hypothetical protein